MLSFFFDGVPDPALGSDAPEAEGQNATDAVTPETAALPLPYEVIVPEMSHHPPVVARQCSACHGPVETVGGGQTAWRNQTFMLALPREKLCAKCHEAPEREFPHGPASTQQCYKCHLHHRSPNPHLLRYAKTRELCTTCHAPNVFATQELHEAYPDNCILCHDPHGGDVQYFLRPDWKERAEGN